MWGCLMVAFLMLVVVLVALRSIDRFVPENRDHRYDEE
jgi:hypothetical protein